MPGICEEKAVYLKVDFRSKSLNLHIYLYFIATKYLFNNDLVEYINNSAQPNSLVHVLIYQNCPKKKLSGQSLKTFSTCWQFEKRKTNLVLFFLSTLTQIPS